MTALISYLRIEKAFWLREQTLNHLFEFVTTVVFPMTYATVLEFISPKDQRTEIEAAGLILSNLHVFIYDQGNLPVARPGNQTQVIVLKRRMLNHHLFKSGSDDDQ